MREERRGGRKRRSVMVYEPLTVSIKEYSARIRRKRKRGRRGRIYKKRGRERRIPLMVYKPVVMSLSSSLHTQS